MNWLKEFLNTVGAATSSFSVGWVDVITVIVFAIGIIRGRKRGLSEEILDLLNWLIIVVACGFLYRQLGDLINQKGVLSPLTAYVMAYLLIALAIWSVFHLIKKRFGQKVIEGDVFGRFEFYGGMVAGIVRCTCVYFFILSLLHAPFYSEAERAQRLKEVEYNYGSDFFPSLCKVQDTIFLSSLTGKGAAKYLDRFLMEQVSGDSKALRDDTSLAKRNERKIDAIMGR